MGFAEGFAMGWEMVDKAQERRHRRKMEEDANLRAKEEAKRAQELHPSALGNAASVAAINASKARITEQTEPDQLAQSSLATDQQRTAVASGKRQEEEAVVTQPARYASTFMEAEGRAEQNRGYRLNNQYLEESLKTRVDTHASQLSAAKHQLAVAEFQLDAAKAKTPAELAEAALKVDKLRREIADAEQVTRALNSLAGMQTEASKQPDQPSVLDVRNLVTNPQLRGTVAPLLNQYLTKTTQSGLDLQIADVRPVPGKPGKYHVVTNGFDPKTKYLVSPNVPLTEDGTANPDSKVLELSESDLQDLYARAVTGDNTRPKWTPTATATPAPAAQGLAPAAQAPNSQVVRDRGPGVAFQARNKDAHLDPALLKLMQDEEIRNNLEPGTLYGVMMTETAGGKFLNSPAGARGLMQFMPATAQQYGVDRDDPLSSIRGAGKYLGALKKQFGDPQKYVTAYHSGEGNVQKGNLGPEGRKYYGTVASYMKKAPYLTQQGLESPAQTAAAQPTPTPTPTSAPASAQSQVEPVIPTPFPSPAQVQPVAAPGLTPDALAMAQSPRKPSGIQQQATTSWWDRNITPVADWASNTAKKAGDQAAFGQLRNEFSMISGTDNQIFPGRLREERAAPTREMGEKYWANRSAFAKDSTLSKTQLARLDEHYQAFAPKEAPKKAAAPVAPPVQVATDPQGLLKTGASSASRVVQPEGGAGLAAAKTAREDLTPEQKAAYAAILAKGSSGQAAAAQFLLGIGKKDPTVNYVNNPKTGQVAAFDSTGRYLGTTNPFTPSDEDGNTGNAKEQKAERAKLDYFEKYTQPLFARMEGGDDGGKRSAVVNDQERGEFQAAFFKTRSTDYPELDPGNPAHIEIAREAFIRTKQLHQDLDYTAFNTLAPMIQLVTVGQSSLSEQQMHNIALQTAKEASETGRSAVEVMKTKVIHLHPVARAFVNQGTTDPGLLLQYVAQVERLTKQVVQDAKQNHEEVDSVQVAHDIAAKMAAQVKQPVGLSPQ